MILIDVNLLIYAYNSADERFPRANTWLSEVLSSEQTVCFCWETINGFIRVSTNSSAMPNPLTLSEAFAFVEEWLSLSNSVILTPTADHFDVLRSTSIDADAAGKHYSDAILAAYAISNKATFATTDRDFRKFVGLKLIDPLRE